MSKVARLFVTLIVSVLLLVVLLVVFERHNLAQNPTWRSTLGAYLQARAAQGVASTLLTTRHASQAATFSHALEQGVYGDGHYYDSMGGMTTVAASGLPVPYSITDVWCTLVQQRQAGSPDVRRVVFVAFHEEMYQGRWIVHEGPAQPFSAAVAQSLENMGCNLP